MYAAFKDILLRILRAPAEAPDPPAGSHASVAVFRASPRFLTYRLAVLGLGAAVGALGLLTSLIATIASGEVAAIVAVVLSSVASTVALVAAIFAIRVDYDLRYYIVTDRSLRIREGAWSVREKTLTYANIQNLRIVQGPIQRLFRIADLRVDTAGGGAARKGDKGGGGHHATLAGIENARELRDEVLAYVKVFQRDSGLGDPDDARSRQDRASGTGLAGSAAVIELRLLRDAAAALRQTLEASAGQG